MKRFNQRLLLLFILTPLFVNAQDTLTIMSYNILKYPQSNSAKADTLKPIIQHVKPDIFMITELTSGAGATTILNDALNIGGVTTYQKATYFNGPDTDNMLYYNSDKLTLYSQTEIPTTLRNISEYILFYNSQGLSTTSDTVFIYCYMAHLKASTGLSNEQQRDQEATALKNYMDTRPNIENVILGGDFNLYTSAEPAYSTILNTGTVNLFDPISSPGAWNNNSTFASIHTQSTRSGTIGDGGAWGGMDDRFDFIFFTNDLFSGTNNLTYIPNSYTALGNDGNHFNQSVNFGINNSAPANVIDALYYMSDHLPVIIKAQTPLISDIKENNYEAFWQGVYTNGKFNFTSSKTEDNYTVFVYDVLGKIIQKETFRKASNFQLKLNHSGIHFIKVITPNRQKSFKVFTTK